MWKWIVKNNYKKGTKDVEDLIKYQLCSERDLEKKDLHRRKNSKSTAAVKQNQQFKVKARVEKNHSILEMLMKK